MNILLILVSRDFLDAGIRDRNIVIRTFLKFLIRCDPHQICLAGHRRTVLLDGFHRGEDLPAERDEVDRGKIKGDVAQGAPHVLIRHVELCGDIFRIFADVQVPVHHDDAHQGRGKEVRHVVV